MALGAVALAQFETQCEGETAVHPGICGRELGWRLRCRCQGVTKRDPAQQDTGSAPGVSHPACAGNGKPTCMSVD